MDGTARITFTSHISSSPTPSPPAAAAAALSPRGFAPLSPVASYSPPLTPTNRVSSAVSVTSPRPPCSSRLATFKGFDESLGCSFKNFEKNFNGCLKRKKTTTISLAAARVGCPTDQQQDISINIAGSTGIRKTYYSILGVRKWASLKEIRLAYRKLALQFHPDVAPLHQLDTATKLFSQINEAYQTLSDPQKRRYYDLNLELQSPTTVTAECGTSRNYTDMSTGRVYPSLSSFYREWKGSHNLETDQCWC